MNKKSPRDYASHFNWPKRDTEEWGVAKTFFESILSNTDEILKTITPHKPDPPDCVAIDKQGNRIGIEVTELVDSDAIKENKKGNKVIEIGNQKRLSKKSKKG